MLIYFPHWHISTFYTVVLLLLFMLKVWVLFPLVKVAVFYTVRFTVIHPLEHNAWTVNAQVVCEGVYCTLTDIFICCWSSKTDTQTHSYFPAFGLRYWIFGGTLSKKLSFFPACFLDLLLNLYTSKHTNSRRVPIKVIRGHVWAAELKNRKKIVV